MASGEITDDRRAGVLSNNRVEYLVAAPSAE